jgi:hypothetical protein
MPNLKAEAMDEAIAFDVAEIAFPLVPQLAELRAEVPGAALFPSSDFSRLFRAEIWYQSYSPFLWPLPFTEAGAELFVTLHFGARSSIGLGAGSALELFDGKMSFPLIASLRYDQGLPWFNLRTGVHSDVLVWTDGMAVELGVPVLYDPGRGWKAGVEAGTAFAILLQGTGVFKARIKATVGYSLGGQR